MDLNKFIYEKLLIISYAKNSSISLIRKLESKPKWTRSQRYNFYFSALAFLFDFSFVEFFSLFWNFSFFPHSSHLFLQNFKHMMVIILKSLSANSTIRATCRYSTIVSFPDYGSLFLLLTCLAICSYILDITDDVLYTFWILLSYYEKWWPKIPVFFQETWWFLLALVVLQTAFKQLF